ncbi:uncharacterized protein LOC131619788 [Vicia villosa]|uniref:uncharacterized protein LOC131619788 n=1 Tax=Vicia villosa TaxID=3911 RepID=UPI00273A9348|nr:uncharacterized protein LOC131619788 [Vicia villosa]
MEVHDLFPETRVKSVSGPSCAKQSSPLQAPSNSGTKPQNSKSFAQILKGVCNIPLSQLPNPVIKGDRPSITIPEEEYEAGIAECKNNLHGRVLWPKGSTPLTVLALKEKLSLLWPDVQNWGVLSLGKGYYEFTFANTEDMRRVRASGAISLHPGSLKLFAWTKDFNPSLQSNTSAQVWVRFFGLSQEYWRPRILFAIASCVGTPICIDAASSKSRMDRTFGQYVRVLIDMDLTKPLNHNVLVERTGFAFFADIEYENLPHFCEHCRKIGHAMHDCKMLQKHVAPQVPKAKATYVQKTQATEAVAVVSNTADEEVMPHDGTLVTPVAPILVTNPLNFISQPPGDSETQLSEFVGPTQIDVDRGKAVQKENAILLHNSWADIADLEEERVLNDGAFTNAVSILKKKQAARNKSKSLSRSQAGPVLSFP